MWAWLWFVWSGSELVVGARRLRTRRRHGAGRVVRVWVAAVSGATVTITKLGTNLQRVLKTNTSGIYGAPGLPPGVYSVRISMPGFKTEVRTSLEVQVDQVARLNFTLQVGAVSETVEVAAAAAACPTADPSPQNPL